MASSNYYRYGTLLTFVILFLMAFQNCTPFEVSMDSASISSHESLVLASFEMQSASTNQRCRDIKFTYNGDDQRSVDAVNFAITEQERMQSLLRASLDQSKLLTDRDLEPNGNVPNLVFQQDNSCPPEASGSSLCRTYHIGASAGHVGNYRMDDGIVIRHVLSEIQNFKKSNPNHWVQIKFSKNTDYYLRSNPLSAWTLGVQGVSNFVFDGNGSNFWVSSHAQFAQFKDCTNCYIKNAQVEHFDRSHTQGTIKSLSQSGNEFYLSIQVDRGFPLPPEDPLYSHCGDGVNRPQQGKLVRKLAHGAFFNGSKIDIVPGNNSYVFLNGAQTINRGQRLIAVRIPASKNPHISLEALKTRLSQMSNLQRKFVFSLPQSTHAHREAMKFQAKNAFGLRSFVAEAEAGFANYSMFMIAGSSNVKVQNFGIHSTVKMAIRLVNNKGRIHLDGVQLIPRGNSLVAGTSDGIHGPNNRGSTIIENSVFKSLMDDGIHLKASGIRAVTKLSNSELILAQPAPQRIDWDLRVGDTLQMIDSATGADLNNYRIKKVEPIINDNFLRYRVTLDKNVVFPAACSESQINLCAYFFNLNDSHINSVVKNNIFENKLRHALITHGGTSIVGNWMEHLQGGVLMTASHIGPEGPVGSRFEVSGNVMIDITELPLNSFIQSSAGARNPRIQTGLEAHCNIFETLGKAVISLKDVQGRMSRNIYMKANQNTQASVPPSVTITHPISADPASDSWCTSQFPSINRLSKYKNRSTFLALNLSSSPSAPPAGSPVLVGLFRTPSGGIYHGFKDFYCAYGNMERVLSVWGSQWAKVAKSVSAPPTNMINAGHCGPLQGIHKQGSHFFYTYKLGYTCWINSTERLNSLAGLNSSNISYLPNKNLASLGLIAKVESNHACQ